MKCKTCGACCFHNTVPPFTAAEVSTLPWHLRRSIRAMRRVDPWGIVTLGRCPWLKVKNGTYRCKHYKHRPRVCRELEVDGKHCTRFVELRYG